jgi:hypothetical protein
MVFVGLGRAERRILAIIRPGVPLTVTDAHRAYPGSARMAHRQAMTSLCRKGFVQRVPGKVFAVGIALLPIGQAPVAATSPRRSVALPGDGVAAGPGPPNAGASSPVQALDAAGGSLATPRETGGGNARPRRETLGRLAVIGSSFASPADAIAAQRAAEVERQKRDAIQAGNRTVI